MNTPIRTALMIALITPVGCEAILPALRLAAAAFSNYDPKYQKYADLVGNLTTALQGDHLLNREGAKATPVGLPPIELEVALLRQVDIDGRVEPETVQNGDVLRFQGSAHDSDRFKLFFRPNADCFVYLINIDSTGWVDPMFPPTDAMGTVTRSGETVFLPDGDELGEAYAVDQNLGIETFYFVASRERRDDIEQLLRQFDSLERPTVEEPASVGVIDEESGLIQRALEQTDVRSRAFIETDAGPMAFDTTTFLQLAGSDLVVTRWFWHR